MQRPRLWSMVVAGLVPVVLVLAAVRILLAPWFVRLEYQRPGFPPDPYGFSTAERLHWAEQARRYLLNPAGSEFLTALRFEDQRPVFNAREIRHLDDVKAVVQGALRVGYLAGALLVLAGWWAWRRGPAAWRAYRAALARGGWLTLFLMGGVLVAVLLAFGPFFVLFHRLFFEGDSWLFRPSDTLIRLFPERFWVDAFLAVALLSGLAAGALILLGRAAQEPTSDGP